MKRTRIAAFDFDGTLTRKDSFVQFIRFSRGSWRFYCGFALFVPLFAAMKIGLVSASRVKQAFFGFFYKGTPFSRFEAWGAGFTDIIDRMLRSEVADTLSKHISNGDITLIISASVETWILPWASVRGVTAVIATKPEVDARGRLTGKFLTPNCVGAEKVRRLAVLYPDRIAYELLAYGDSSGDRELLLFADVGIKIKDKR
jgi:HAD superfamily hydrolase (TIGR01490 family)